MLDTVVWTVAGIAIGVGLVLAGTWAVRNPDSLQDFYERNWFPDKAMHWNVDVMPRVAQGFGALLVLVSLSFPFR